MKEATRNFILGLTTLAAGVGLVALLLLFGELDGVIKPRYQIIIQTNNAAGLRTGSGVELNGVPIGTVDHIKMFNGGDFPVTVTVLIDEQVKIPSDVVPYATSSPLGGAATLQFDRSRPNAPVPGWIVDDGAGQITDTIRSRLVQEVTDALDEFISPLLSLAENINSLLELPDPTNPAAVETSIRTTVSQVNRSLKQIEQLVGNLNEVFGTPDLTDPDAAAESIRTTIRNANTALEDYSNLARTLERDINTIAEGVLPAMTKLEAALNEVQLLAHQAREGQGTVGQLMNNPDLFLSLNDTMKMLEQLIVEARLLVQKIKAEGINVDL